MSTILMYKENYPHKGNIRGVIAHESQYESLIKDGFIPSNRFEMLQKQKLTKRIRRNKTNTKNSQQEFTGDSFVKVVMHKDSRGIIKFNKTK